MARRYLALVMLALLAAPLLGCGSSEKPEDNPNVTTNDPKANLISKPKGMPGGGGAPAATPATN